MRLCDDDIITWLDEGRLVVTPRPIRECIHGVTIDIHLGNKFRTFCNHTVSFLDLSQSQDKISTTLNQVMSDEIILTKNEMFYLHPGTLALAITYEFITLPNNLVGWLDGRSSLARLGLMVHITAHRIDPGWSGYIVLEFFNVGRLPLALRPGMKIGALSFELLHTAVKHPYNCG